MLTHENQNWTNEISKRKSVGPTKYPRERDSNPRNTYEKKISGSQKDDDTIARARSRRPTMVRNSRNLAHSSTSPKKLMKKIETYVCIYYLFPLLFRLQEFQTKTHKCFILLKFQQLHYERQSLACVCFPIILNRVCVLIPYTI